MWGRLPQCLSRFLVVSSVLKETCLPFSDSRRPLRGLRANRGVRDTGAVLRAQLFLQGSRIRSQTCKPRSWVSRLPSLATPNCLVTMSGKLPSVELGSGPPGWDFTDLPMLFAFWPPSPRGRRRAAAGRGHPQHSPYPVSALEDYASKHPTSAREGDFRG